MRGIFKSLVGIIAAASLIGGATWAYFSDTATSENNTFAAGSLKFGSPVDAQFNVSDIAPGDEFAGTPDSYSLDNAGTIDADHIEIAISNSVTDTNEDADPDMDEMLIVSKLEYGSINLKSVIESNPGSSSWENGIYGVRLESGNTFGALLNASGAITLDRWEKEVIEIYDDPDTAGAPNGLAAATGVDFNLDVKFDEEAGNEYQEDSVETTLTFTLNQNSSQ